MQQPKPDSKKYNQLISEIENGDIKIPKFQRDFVWSLDKTAKLLDSILKGYPIGTFILWETSKRLSEVREIGGLKFHSTPRGINVQYILDGQQRITSIFLAHRGEKEKEKEGKNKINDYSKIYVDLNAIIKEDSDEHIVVSKKLENNKYISFHELLTANLSELRQNYSNKEMDKIKIYKRIFKGYKFSTITLRRENIASAVEVFTRINTGGQALTLFQIMSAKNYEEKKFDMEHDFKELLIKLKKKQYGTISPTVLLYLLSLVLSKNTECRRKVILELDKQEIIDKWGEVISAVEESIDYFRLTYHINASAILPYDVLLVPFAYFYYHNNKRNPEGQQAELLKEFFWRMSLSKRYSSSVETNLSQDIKKRIAPILAGERPEYRDIKIDFAPEDLIGTGFSTGKSYCNAILCLLASHQPKDFYNSDKVVDLKNDCLKRANSRNYHHFFPKEYLKQKGIPNANSIVNITLVSSGENQKFKAKAPSVYLSKKYSRLSESLKSHLIGDMDDFGIKTDKYDVFLQKRAEAIHLELKKRMEPKI